MLPNDEIYELFTGILFFEGGEHIPDDLPVNLTDIREWAEQSGLIFDPDQLMNRERFEDISQFCSKEDELLIGLSLSDKYGSLVYVEYPYMWPHIYIKPLGSYILLIDNIIYIGSSRP